MLKATKKVYMSILAILLVFITVVATTFAWVGILTYAQTDTFKMNLKVQDLENDYYLSISATGQPDDFSENGDTTELKKQIIKNMGYSIDELTTPQLVDKKFNSVYRIRPVTTTRDTILDDEFHEILANGAVINDARSNNFYKFDIYISMEHRNGDEAITTDTNVKMDLVLSNISQLLIGDIATKHVANDFTYPSSDYLANDVYNPYGLTTIKTDTPISVNAASAARIALAVYDPIERTSNYTGLESPSKLYIYQGGSQLPRYYEETNLYSFGGILPEEYNLALYEHKMNKVLGPQHLIIPDDALNRGDLELTEENRFLIDGDFGFGIKHGIKSKLKITTYFWFEGWDADCFDIINAINVEVNISLTTGEVIQQ
jgi:hypothetical protein